MNVTELWAQIVRWLTDHAPVTASALRPVDSIPDFTELETSFGARLPEPLHDWWRCSAGTEHDALADVFPPFYTPYGPHRAHESWCEHREKWREQWDRPACDYYAGSAGQSYHPAWIPIAGDGFADELVIDLRPGPLHGCVLEWEQEAGQVARPEWAGIIEMLRDVLRALEEGTSAGHSYPTVTQDGRLDWQIG